MHPALRKGPRFLQTPHFPFFTKNTPILHFCTKKTPLPISFPAYRPAHSARLRPWSVDNQRGTFSCTNPISTQTNAPNCCNQSSDIHRTQTTHAADISISETGHVLLLQRNHILPLKEILHKSNFNTNKCSYLLLSIIWHSPDTNDSCNRHFNHRNRPCLTPCGRLSWLMLAFERTLK